MKNFQETPLLLTYILCYGQTLIILWSVSVNIRFTTVRNTIYCPYIVVFVLILALYVINQWLMMLIVQNILKFRKHACIGSQRYISGKITVRGCVVITFYYFMISIIRIFGFRTLKIPKTSFQSRHSSKAHTITVIGHSIHEPTQDLKGGR